ncbi:thioredoxin domain-containing protein [Piscinibacter sakaiensis]|uniref:Thiol-disulfide isomerase and thioredoxins n=1 Tax=Piscinibacter sakaiensis TaxID=1547922 RepID=A0A0K8P6M2_PISS1|nr:thioredoxin domain-containing protein [Piscinibacter sakaiensis]GAP37865.1 thiol-disulfide isomerase and thioredoxins [Piscinibacter sakaiensis]
MSSPNDPDAAAPPLLVACLCARWCRLCGEYAAVFADAAAREADAARFVWIDIEDDEAVLGPVEVDDFPTLLIARGAEARFFGPLTPQPGTLARLLRSARDDALGRADGAALPALVARVWAHARAGAGAGPAGP